MGPDFGLKIRSKQMIRNKSKDRFVEGSLLDTVDLLFGLKIIKVFKPSSSSALELRR